LGEIGAGAGDVGEHFGEEAAGAAFSSGQDSGFRVQEKTRDDLLQGLIVGAEDQVAEGGAAGGFGFVVLLLRFVFAGGAGVEAEGDDAVGDGGADGGVAITFHQVPEFFGDGGFAQAEGVEGAGENDGAGGGLRDVGENVAREHDLHFFGDAGHDEDFRWFTG